MITTGSPDTPPCRSIPRRTRSSGRVLHVPTSANSGMVSILSTKAIQELISSGDTARDKQPGAVAGLRRLAKAVGRECDVDVDGVPAVAVGGVIHHTGLLWRPGGRRALKPVAGSVHTLTREGAGTWHCAVSVVFTVAGKKVRAGAVQLSPFDQSWCASDANQLLRAFNRDDVSGLLSGDLNGNGATTVFLPDGGEEFYDPDPYVGVAWHPDHVYELDADGSVDRQAAIRVERLGRMRDCARITNSKWAHTTRASRRQPPTQADRPVVRHLSLPGCRRGGIPRCRCRHGEPVHRSPGRRDRDRRGCADSVSPCGLGSERPDQ